MENIEVSAQEGGVAKQTVDVFFAVQSPVYSLAVEPASLDFGTLYTGYGAPAGKQITIRNTGTVGVTLNSGVSLANFTVDRFSKTTLAAGETATATVTPKVGLTSGNYDTTVDISTLDNSAKATLSWKLMVGRYPHSAGYYHNQTGGWNCWRGVSSRAGSHRRRYNRLEHRRWQAA